MNWNDEENVEADICPDFVHPGHDLDTQPPLIIVRLDIFNNLHSLVFDLR